MPTKEKQLELKNMELDDKKRIQRINRWRARSMAVAEAVDAWRVVPRAMVAGYAVLTYYVINWYMKIEPIILKSNCKLIEGQQLCDITGMIGPSTQQAALVTTVIGAAAVVIGLYTSTGRDWHRPVSKWFKRDDKRDEEKKD